MSACYKNNCFGKSFIISVIVGIITAVLKFFAVITVGNAFLWFAFGTAIVTLATFVWIAAFTNFYDVRNCLRQNLLAFVTGIFGTLLTCVVLFATTFTSTSVAGAIITGLLLTFLTLILTTATHFVKCVVEN